MVAAESLEAHCPNPWTLVRNFYALLANGDAPAALALLHPRSNGPKPRGLPTSRGR